MPRRHRPPILLQVSPTEIIANRRRLSYFGGCDYFRLSWHSKVRRALARAAGELCPGVAASRLTSGNHPIYSRLETVLQQWLRFPVALLTGSGYSAPLLAAQALSERVTHVLLAAPTHGCLEDAAVLSGLRILRFRKRDRASLRACLRRAGRGARVALFTEGLSGHDGTVPPLADYLDQLPTRGWMLVDDAHGVGTIGENGRGVLEHLRVRDRRILLAMTFSKALGTHGGAVLGPEWLRQAVEARCRAYAGSTPLPPPVIAASLAAIDVLRNHGPGMRRRLRRHLAAIRKVLTARESGAPETPGPVIAVVPDEPAQRERLRRELFRARILPPWIQYPGGPYPGFFRFALSSAHSRAEIDRLAKVLAVQTSSRTMAASSPSPSRERVGVRGSFTFGCPG